MKRLYATFRTDNERHTALAPLKNPSPTLTGLPAMQGP